MSTRRRKQNNPSNNFRKNQRENSEEMRPPTAAASSSRSGRRSRSSTVATTSAPTPCCSKVGMKKGPWTPEEDKKLSDYVRKEGEGRWRTLPTRAGLARCGKSCRLRWMNYLRPSIKHGDISQDEEDLILRLHRLLGNRWALIAGRIPGRTDNEIKNYWNTHLSRKLISQGIDPRNHKPLGSDNPNSNPSSGELPVLHSNTNFNPLTPSPEKANASGNGIIINNDRVVDYFHGNNNENEAGWQNSDNSTGGHVGKDGSNDDIDDLSSFLDSLINDDMFLLQEQQHLQQQQQISGDGSDANDRTNHINLLMNTSSADFRVGSLWGDSVSSIDALDEDLTG